MYTKCLLGHTCYQTLAWPNGLDGLTFWGEPMTDVELETFLAQCSTQLERRQAYFAREFDLGCWGGFHLDIQGGTLTVGDRMSSLDEPWIVAQIIPIGFYDPNVAYWRWSWADDTLSLILRQRSQQLQGLSQYTGLQLFQAVGFEANTSLTWDLTAMACHYLDALGCYRASWQGGYLFLALQSVDLMGRAVSSSVA